MWQIGVKSPALARRSFERLGPILYTGFGQTEAYGLNTWMTPEEHVAALETGGERLASVGRECTAFAQVRIRTEDGSENSNCKPDRAYLGGSGNLSISCIETARECGRVQFCNRCSKDVKPEVVVFQAVWSMTSQAEKPVEFRS